ncbi:MAG: sugar transferase [Bacteroidetes bacterium]|nr:sugar transferase [Bacteroidota bacterium]
MKNKILLIDDNEIVLGLLSQVLQEKFDVFLSTSIKEAQELLEKGVIPQAIVTDLYLNNENGKSLIGFLKNDEQFKSIPLIVLSGDEKSNTRIECLTLGADDYIVKPFHPEELTVRIEKLIMKSDADFLKKKVENINLQNQISVPNPAPSFRKRLFDIFISSLALLALSPLLVIVAILIKIDSKGPVFFLSKRIGSGYKVFELYKFRTMKVGAEKMIANMGHLNMYSAPQEEISKKISEEGELINDEGWQSEGHILEKKSGESAYLKFKDDPRITKLGNFLRNTSIDELPQLINILKGDMSIVGNRPLPLYEAEKLTSDQAAARFMAPAGLTGLWQVSKRGRGEMSAEERQELDNEYAKNHDWKMDMKLVAKTFPALFQSENV